VCWPRFVNKKARHQPKQSVIDNTHDVSNRYCPTTTPAMPHQIAKSKVAHTRRVLSSKCLLADIQLDGISLLKEEVSFTPVRMNIEESEEFTGETIISNGTHYLTIPKYSR
jgi:hypothetical protein